MDAKPLHTHDQSGNCCKIKKELDHRVRSQPIVIRNGRGMGIAERCCSSSHHPLDKKCVQLLLKTNPPMRLTHHIRLPPPLLLVIDLDLTLIEGGEWPLAAGVTGVSTLSIEPEELVADPSVRFTTQVRVRPGAERFLQSVTGMGYICHAYTQAWYTYAEEVLQLLDPTGCIFGGRVVTREYISNNGTTKLAPKSLQRLKCKDPRLAVILDDRMDVWNEADRANVLPVYPYTYLSQNHGKTHNQWPADEDTVLSSLLPALQAVRSLFFGGGFGSRSIPTPRSCSPSLPESSRSATITEPGAVIAASCSSEDKSVCETVRIQDSRRAIELVQSTVLEGEHLVFTGVPSQLVHWTRLAQRLGARFEVERTVVADDESPSQAPVEIKLKSADEPESTTLISTRWLEAAQAHLCRPGTGKFLASVVCEDRVQQATATRTLDDILDACGRIIHKKAPEESEARQTPIVSNPPPHTHTHTLDFVL